MRARCPWILLSGAHVGPRGGSLQHARLRDGHDACVSGARDASCDAGDAARDALRDATRDASCDASCDAARDALRDATRDASAARDADATYI